MASVHRWTLSSEGWQRQVHASCLKVKSCALPLLRYLSIYFTSKALASQKWSFTLAYLWTTGLFCSKWQNVCVSIDQMEDSFHIFTCWGSDCFRFHHVLVFTLTESLMGCGAGKNGCVLQLIISSECRTCPSFARLLYGTTRPSVCLSVWPFICSVGCVQHSRKSHCLCDKNRLILFANDRDQVQEGDKRIVRRWEGEKQAARWEGVMSEREMKTGPWCVKDPVANQHASLINDRPLAAVCAGTPAGDAGVEAISALSVESWARRSSLLDTALFLRSRPISRGPAWLLRRRTLLKKELQSIKLIPAVRASAKSLPWWPTPTIKPETALNPMDIYCQGTALNLYGVIYKCYIITHCLENTHKGGHVAAQ